MRCNGFDVALEDQKVLRFDKNILLFEGLVIGLIRDNFVIEAIFTQTCGGNTAKVLGKYVDDDEFPYVRLNCHSFPSASS